MTGKSSWGVESGVLGTYTLRLIRPLLTAIHHGEVVGYIEFGIELEHLFSTISGGYGADLVLLLEKSVMGRTHWERRLRRLQQEEEWDRFPGHVTLFSSSDHAQEEVWEHLSLQQEGGSKGKSFLFQDEEESVEFILVPLRNLFSGVPGILVGVVDITAEVERMESKVWRFYGISLVALLLLVTATYLYLHLVEVTTQERYRESERMVDRYIEELQQAQAVKDEFLASMSHELRTPLTSIIGNSELVLEQSETPQQRQLLTSIQIAGRNQLALVNDILDLSKIESGKFTIEEHPYDLERTVNELIEIFTPQAHNTGLELRLEMGYHPSRQLLGDRHRIIQMLNNLVSNAIKFTDRGAVVLTVSRRGGQLLLAVEDSGIGIEATALERLFSRFQQADSSISRRFGGTGLGLHITRSLAEMMGGAVSVSSELGVGSRFVIELPLQESDQPLEISSSEAEGEATVGEKRFQGRVLVAEDTPELQLMVRRMLERYLVVAPSSEPSAAGDPPSAPSDSTVIEVEPLKVEEEEEIDAELRALFIEMSTERHQELIDALEAKGWEELYQVAHKIKGSGKMVGFPHLTECADALCQAQQRREYDRLPELTRRLLQELERVLGGDGSVRT